MKRLLSRLTFAVRVLFVNDPSLNTGRQLTSWGHRLGLSFKKSRPFVHLWKNLKEPRLAVRHKLLARHVSKVQMTSEQTESLQEGYATFSVDTIPNGRNVSVLLINLWKKRCFGNQLDEEMLWRAKNNDYHALRDCLKVDDFLQHPEIGDFILNDLFVALATHYLGGIPRLGSVMLWWSTANDTTKASQLYHTDTEDGRQLKFFVNLTEVRPENGPFTFFPASISKSIRTTLGHDVGRLRDKDVNRDFSSKKAFPFIGAVGSGIAVDTSNCLHYGSRTRQGERLILMTQYVPFNVQRESSTPAPILDLKRYLDDPIRYLIARTANNQNHQSPPIYGDKRRDVTLPHGS